MARLGRPTLRHKELERFREDSQRTLFQAWLKDGMTTAQIAARIFTPEKEIQAILANVPKPVRKNKPRKKD